MSRLALFLLLIAGPVAAQTAAPSSAWTKEQQISAAVLPLPEAMREGAAVYAVQGAALVPLRPGTNAMMCLAEDPAKKNFHVACYHRDLEPFMAAGRTRTAGGMKREAVDSARHADIAAKRWAMPAEPTALYELFGPDGAYDPVAGTVSGATPVYVLYLPFATAESTGLVLSGLKGGQPWLMYPGEPWAHVMVTP